MPAIFRKLAIALPAFLIFAIAGWAQTGSIEGDVKDEKGQPIKGAVVKFDRKDIKGHVETKTDKKGHYFYGGFPPGATFRISLEVEGTVRDQVDNIRVSLGDPARADFNLKDTAARKQSMAQAMATGTLTKEQERALSPEQREALQKQMKEQAAQISKSKELNDAYNEGRTALDAKQFDVATQAFEKAAAVDPKQPAVWANMGEAYSGLAQAKTGPDQDAAYAKAMESYNKALELQPENASFHNNLGTILARAKKYPEAQAEFNKAVQLDPPGASKYYYNLGAILVNAGQSDPAAEAFKKAIEADPNNADAEYQYGVALSAKLTTTPDGKIVPPPGMQEALEKYLQLAPTGPNAESAKALLQSIGSTVQTQIIKPGAKTTTQKKK